MAALRSNSLDRILRPYRVKSMTAGEYLEVCRTQPDNIESARIIPPSFRRNDWGGISVRFKMPVLMHAR